MFIAPCTRPLYAFRDNSSLSETGKPILRFIRSPEKPEFRNIEILTIPCGQCINCRLAHSRKWAVRMMHEAQMHENNCFITLTYAPEYLPSDGSLHLDHFQKFMKRLRKKYGAGIRFFHCGEYGEENKRPHYHCILFGFDFPDKKFFKSVYNPKGDGGSVNYYVSESLAQLWPFGHCLIGDVTFESCAYVARYILKKVTGEKADAHYNGLAPEYITMSRRPGIGHSFYLKYWRDMYPQDVCVDSRGYKGRPPAYYDKLYESEFPASFHTIKENRAVLAAEIKDDDLLRMMQREEYSMKIMEQLPRPLEKENL